jgi:hypothetical protein
VTLRGERVVSLSWSALKKRKYKVVASPLVGGRKGAWSAAEEAALLRRRNAGEAQQSIAVGLGRTLPSVRGKMLTLTNANYANSGDGGIGIKHARMGWATYARAALDSIGGSGTVAEIFAAYKKTTQFASLDAFQLSKSPGAHPWPRWQHRISQALAKGNREWVQQLPGQHPPVWQVIEVSDEALRVAKKEASIQHARDEEKKRKAGNAKAGKRGYDGVHMNC